MAKYHTRNPAKVYGRMLYIREVPRTLRCISAMRGGNSTWTEYRDAGLLYGSEYQIWSAQPNAQNDDNDVPCALCFTDAREVIFMLPGKYTCPSGWTREYHGYLMTERHNHKRSTFECMNFLPEATTGGHAHHNSAFFYYIEARCGSLPCPPYEEEKELTCAVCTK